MRSEDGISKKVNRNKSFIYECMRCGRKITEEEYETYSGMCEECYEIEIDELDYEE